jgi:hypothetical protein
VKHNIFSSLLLTLYLAIAYFIVTLAYALFCHSFHIGEQHMMYAQHQSKYTLILNNIKLLTIGLAAAILLSLIPATISASVQGSPHDVTTNQCDMCHLYMEGKGQIPQWDSSLEPANYISYESISHDMENSRESQSPTMLCIGCHNGIFGNLTQTSASITSDMQDVSDEAAVFRADVGSNHPVCFLYDPAKDVDNNNFPRAVAMPENPDRKAIPGVKTGAYYPLYGTNQDRFECTTCHNPHYASNNSVTGIYQVTLLRTDNTRSSMCIDCHKNKY